MTLRKAAAIVAAALAFAWLLGTGIYRIQQQNDVAVSAQIAQATPFVLGAVPLYTTAPHVTPRARARRVAPKPKPHRTTRHRITNVR